MSEELSLPSYYDDATPLTYDEIEVGKRYFYNPGLGDSSHIVNITLKNKNFIRINYEDDLIKNKIHNIDINVSEVNKEFSKKKKNTFFNIITLTTKEGGGKRKRKSRRNRKSRQNQRKKSRQSRRR